MGEREGGKGWDGGREEGAKEKHTDRTIRIGQDRSGRDGIGQGILRASGGGGGTAVPSTVATVPNISDDDNGCNRT